MTKKNTRFNLRISQGNLNTLRRKAKQSEMTMTDYLTACALDRKIVVVEGLPELITQLKSVGRNLNQLTTLANMERIRVVDLAPFTTVFGDVYAKVHRISKEISNGNL